MSGFRESPSLLRAGAGVGFAAMLSRVMGFARDVLIAAALGAGPAADALLAALRLPNLLRRMLSEGAVNAGFVPLHARIAAERGEGAATRFADAAFSTIGAALVLLVALAQIVAGPLILAMASGYADHPETYSFATLLNRIALPATGLLTLSAVAGAILNARGRFRAAALAPLVVNAAMIALLAAALAGAPVGPRGLAIALAACFSLGGLAQLAILVGAVRRAAGGLRPVRPRVDADLRRLAALGLPAFFAAGAAQLVLLAALHAASATPSAVAHLHYADRLFQLPLGLIGAAVGVALLPAVAAGWRAGDRAACAAAMNRAVEATLLVSAPAAVALALAAEPMVAALFERGAFGAGDRAGVAAMLAGLAPGLPFAAFAKTLGQWLFAAERMRAAALSTLAAFVVALVACSALGGRYGGYGVGLGASLAFAFHAGLVALLVAARGDWRPDRRLASRLLRALPALGLLALGLALVRAAAPVWGIGLLSLVCVGGVALYGGAALASGAIRLADLRALAGARRESAGSGLA